ncbi:MAG TPA: hypothetical protein VFI31_02560 [Pirellulales bacterium]|nr:hypothetical protein [Pirellulales bacterium]
MAPLALGVLLLAGLLAFVAPGLSILVIVLASPVLARTWAAVERRKSRDRPATTEERMHALGASTGIVLVAALATSIAFTAVCFPLGLPFFTIEVGPRTRPSPQERANVIGLVVAFGAGGIAGLAAGFFVMRRYWPKKVD